MLMPVGNTHEGGLRVALASLLQQERSLAGIDPLGGVDEQAYLGKLFVHAEMVCSYSQGALTGFLAFYCNDLKTLVAYITLVVVAPSARGSGLGRELVQQVLGRARRRGFAACELEVRQDNAAAVGLYRSLGFRDQEHRGSKLLMRCPLTPPAEGH